MDLMRKTVDFFSEQRNSAVAAIPALVAEPKLKGSQGSGNAGDGRVNLTCLERRSRS